MVPGLEGRWFDDGGPGLHAFDCDRPSHAGQPMGSGELARYEHAIQRGLLGRETSIPAGWAPHLDKEAAGA